MTLTPARRILAVVSLLAVGCALGATFALADLGDEAVIDITICDELVDLEGVIRVVDGLGYVTFPRSKRAPVVVRGWDAVSKRASLVDGSTVRVTGVNHHGKKAEYRGHVTVLK